MSAVFLTTGLLVWARHPLLGALQIVLAAVPAAIWLRVVRTYRDVFADGSSLIAEDEKGRIVVSYDAILKVHPMFYLRAPVIVITYRTDQTTAKPARLCFVAINDSVAEALVDGTFFAQR